MNIKEQLEKIKNLSDEVCALKNEIDDHVSDIAYRFSEACPDKHNRPSSKGNFGEWNIDENMVVCNWSDSWSYGGYDEGSVYVPIEYIYNNDKFEEFMRQCAVNKEVEKTLAERQKLHHKRLTFEQLKRELGE